MPTNLYGHYANYNLETSHILPALIRKFHLAKLLRCNRYEEIRKDIKKFPIGFDINSDDTLYTELKNIGITFRISYSLGKWGSL